MKKITLLSLFMLFVICAFSQKRRAENWFFGVHAGLNFSTGSPVVIPADSMYTPEGCSTISDTSGNLLFYTDGITVYNKNNTAMPNGRNLLGGNSSTQDALIVPMPGNLKKYYLFTTGSDADSNGLRFSIVDMALQGGLGDLTVRDSQLILQVPEKVSAVKDPFSNRYWIMGHAWGTNGFYAYELNSSGLQAPVISNAGLVIGGSSQNAYGQMKFNACGNKLILANGYMNKIELFDFNTSTGVVSNPVTINIGFHVYGAEFSPDQTKLYLSTYNPNATLVQFDITSGVASTILASAVVLSNTSDIYALQIGPDQKIYVCKSFSQFLGVINYPDSAGVSCQYNDNGVDLDPNFMGNTSGLGLPGFVQSYFLFGMSCPQNTGIHSVAEASIAVHPNPSSDLFTLDAYAEELHIMVFDTKGVKVDEFSSTPLKSTNFGKEYPRGMYYVRATGNGIQKTMKLIKAQ